MSSNIAARAENPRRALAFRLKVLLILARHSPESLAVAAGMPVERVLGVKVAEFFREVGSTPEGRVLLGVFEEEGLGESWAGARPGQGFEKET